MTSVQFDNSLNVVYTEIKDLSSGNSYNIICRVVEVYPWVQTKGIDFVMTLKVTSLLSPKYIFIKIFSSKKSSAFDYKKDDILKICGITYFRKDFYILDKKGLIELQSNDLPENKSDEQKHVSTNSNKGKLLVSKTISEMLYIEFVTFYGLLIYIHKESENLCILGFIDYTVNKNVKKSINRGFYENNMVLYVRVWDNLSKTVQNLEELSIYCLENLKVKVEINKLFSDLSDNSLSKITLVTDQQIIDKIKSRKKQENKKLVEFSKNVYKSSRLVLLKNIKVMGFYKVQVMILRHHPANGIYLDFCKSCKMVTGNKKSLCNCNYLSDRVFIVKYLVKDESAERVLIAKDDIAKAMLSRNTFDTKLELLVFCTLADSKVFLEIKDMPKL